MGRDGKLTTGEVVELSIQELGPDGAGRAVGPGGRRFRVPGTLAGERVRARVVFASRGGLSVAHPAEVAAPSRDRVPAGCPHALQCGGCDLLHARVEAQHAFKRTVLSRALDAPAPVFHAVVPSPRTHGYRTLAKLVVGPGRVLGSYRPRGHIVQDMSGCRVHAPEVERVVEAARRALREESSDVDLRYLIVRGSLAERRTLVVLVTRGALSNGVRKLAERLFARPDVAQVFHHVNDRDGDALLTTGPMHTLHDEGPLFEQLGPVQQRLSPRGFVQVNPLAAAELYRRAIEALRPSERTFIDLYAGSGGLSLSLISAGARHVTAVERDGQAVRAARAAATAQGVADRLSILESDVQPGLMELRSRAVDGVVVNPPRKGAGPEVIRLLSEMTFERLVYVSCNPASLAEDLAGAPYTIEQVVPVDLFPHTRHIETLLVARRRRGL